MMGSLGAIRTMSARHPMTGSYIPVKPNGNIAFYTGLSTALIGEAEATRHTKFTSGMRDNIKINVDNTQFLSNPCARIAENTGIGVSECSVTECSDRTCEGYVSNILQGGIRPDEPVTTAAKQGH